MLPRMLNIIGVINIAVFHNYVNFPLKFVSPVLKKKLFESQKNTESGQCTRNTLESRLV